MKNKKILIPTLFIICMCMLTPIDSMGYEGSSSGAQIDAAVARSITNATDIDTAEADIDALEAYFSSDLLLHENGGVEADVSAYTGILAITGGATYELNTAAELETAAGLGAYASDILAATSEADFKSIVNLEIGTDVEAQVTEGSLDDSVIVSADIKDATIAAGDLNDTQDWSGKDITLAPYPTLTLELDDLSDSTSPHNIVENETRGFIISNGNASADAVLDFEDSALAEGRDFCVVIEAAYQITIEPDTDENWYLNGTQCGANDAIFNDDDTVGEMVCCISTERNMFCVSQDANWECE
jgi:hypothetical protein